MINSEEVVSEFESKLSFESITEKSDSINVVESIFEAELTESLNEVKEISEKDDDGLEEEREKQRKDAREKVKKKEAPAKETPKKEKKNSL